MARAKNTSRAEARRRTRETARADQFEAESADDAEAIEAAETETTQTPERRSMFRIPDFRADIRALPQIFRSRRLLWVPALLLLGGFAIILVLPALPSSIAGIADLYIQFFFIPPALFTFFVAGFVAPRASYLVGFLYGVFASILWSMVILWADGGLGTATTGTAGTATTSADPLVVVSNMLVIGAMYGTLAAAFAAWYRDFLRNMQERGRQRRADQEVKERAKRREERQESRRIVKQRPST